MTLLVVVLLLLLLLLLFPHLMQIGLDDLTGTMFRPVFLGMLELILVRTLLRYVFVKVHVQEGLGDEVVAVFRPFLLMMVMIFVILLCTLLRHFHA